VPVSNASCGSGASSGLSIAKNSPTVPGAVRDPAPLVLLVPDVEQRVQLGYRAHLGNRDQVVAAEPADLALLDSPSTRESRRIAAYSSTLDIDCIRASRHTYPSRCRETPPRVTGAYPVSRR
jgi:hypothetical protein